MPDDAFVAGVLFMAGVEWLSVESEVASGLKIVLLSDDAVCEPDADSGKEFTSLEVPDGLLEFAIDFDVVDLCPVCRGVVADDG